MNDMPNHSQREVPSRDRSLPPPAVRPGASATPAQFREPAHGTDMATLAQMAAQLLEDPMAVRQLGDRVFELLQQDLRLQRERSHGYGQRH